MDSYETYRIHLGAEGVLGNNGNMIRDLPNSSGSSSPNPWVVDSYNNEIGENYSYAGYPPDDNNWYTPNGSSTATEYYDPGQNYSYDVAPADMTSTQTAAEAGMSLFYGNSAGPAFAASPVPLTSTVDGPPEAERGQHICLVPGCGSRTPFRRKADLERHYQQRHAAGGFSPSSGGGGGGGGGRPVYPCDYPRCARASEPFHRVDHCRDHYRDFHCEDLTRRRGAEPDDWWRGRRLSSRWWRCPKCLARNRLDTPGSSWACTGCKTQCDSVRRVRRGYEAAQSVAAAPATVAIPSAAGRPAISGTSAAPKIQPADTLPEEDDDDNWSTVANRGGYNFDDRGVRW